MDGGVVAVAAAVVVDDVVCDVELAVVPSPESSIAKNNADDT